MSKIINCQQESLVSKHHQNQFPEKEKDPIFQFYGVLIITQECCHLQMNWF